MKRLRRWTYYGFFFLLSILANVVLFFPFRSRDDAKKETGVSAARPMSVQVAKKAEPSPEEAAAEAKRQEIERERQELAKKREELEQQLAVQMEAFKQLQLKMKEMEDVERDKEARIAAQQARQEELERQLSAAVGDQEKAREVLREELRQEAQKAVAEKDRELSEKLAEAERKAEEREEALRKDLARQSDDAVQAALASEREKAEEKEKELQSKLVENERKAEERERRLREELARQSSDALAKALAQEREKSQEKERELDAKLLATTRSLDAMRESSRLREADLEKKLQDRDRQLAGTLESERRQAAEREEALRRDLAAEKNARLAAESQRQEDLAELNRKIAASREAQAARPRTSHKAASITSYDQYVEFLRPYLVREVRKEGVPLPIPGFDLAGTRQLLELVRYYNFQLVAYPEDESKRGYFVEVSLDSSGNREYRRDESFQKLFNTMVLRLDGIEYFEKIKEDLARQAGLADGGSGALSIAFVTPDDRARYLRWKAIKVCEDNGQDPREVFQCVGLFRRTDFGAWVFLIDHLVLDSGQLVQVKDFEAEKVFGG